MKILILQLARLGDIYSTWPTIHALKRQYPDCEIHICARKKFSPAFTGCEAVDKIIHLPTEELFKPILTGHISDCANGVALDSSLEVLDDFLEILERESYTHVYNLTFSPFSSYLTHYLSNTVDVSRGYTRHSDGFLALNDDISAYFYAQVGLGKKNRFHIADIFSEICGVSLIEEDWRPKTETAVFKTDDFDPRFEKYIVLHCGASTRSKSYSPEKWANVIRLFLNKEQSHRLVLIGSEQEKEIARKILLGIKQTRLVDLVGKTKIADLFCIIKSARLLVGCDSAPIHIASLTNTPCLNLSNMNVNFWETGPKAVGSRILYSPNFDMLTSDKVVKNLLDMLDHSVGSITDYVSINGNRQYSKVGNGDEDFCWNLIKAMYQGEDFPISNTYRFYEALQKIDEVNEIALEQLNNFKADPTQAEILNRVDDLLKAIGDQAFEVRPLINWYEAEKIRLGPGSQQELLENYLRIHSDLKFVTNIYLSVLDNDGKEAINDTEDMG